ncbi:MAG: ATPase, partial [Pseudomonadota bacterium]
AGNLKLELKAGGLWREDWDGGSVSHGRVLMVQEGEGLRLDAPFGPLQGMGIASALTLTITPREGGGSNLNMVFIATGAEQSNLDQLAGPVDGVWSQALDNLVAAD